MSNLLTDLDTQSRLWAAGLGWPTEALLRLLIAVAAGALVGLEREVRGRQAGFRTHLLVCLGSALVMLVSISFAAHPWHPNGFTINVDPARLAYGVMTGIGFLCAGTIIKHESSVRGLTTAASLWCVASVGLAAGFGLYVVTFAATLLIVVALWVLDRLERHLPKNHYRHFVIRRPWQPGCVALTKQRLRDAKMRVNDVSFERRGDLATVDITLQVSYTNKAAYEQVTRQLETADDLQLIAIRES